MGGAHLAAPALLSGPGRVPGPHQEPCFYVTLPIGIGKLLGTEGHHFLQYTACVSLLCESTE